MTARGGGRGGDSVRKFVDLPNADTGFSKDMRVYEHFNHMQAPPRGQAEDRKNAQPLPFEPTGAYAVRNASTACTDLVRKIPVATAWPPAARGEPTGAYFAVRNVSTVCTNPVRKIPVATAWPPAARGELEARAPTRARTAATEAVMSPAVHVAVWDFHAAATTLADAIVSSRALRRAPT